MKRKLSFDKLIDTYLDHPIVLDCVLVSVIISANYLFPIIPFTMPQKDNQINIISNLIGTTVSLAGFILAALTIIVTFKSSLKVKGFQDSNTALEYLFSTDHYPKIVGAFRKSITELVIIFVLLYSVWFSCENLSKVFLSNFILGAFMGTITSVGRSLLVLFKIFSLDFTRKE